MLLLASYINAQNAKYFSKTLRFKNGYFQIGNTVVENSNATYTVLGEARYPDEYFYYMNLTTFNIYGDTLYNVKYYQPDTSLYGSVLLKNNKGYAISFSQDDNLDEAPYNYTVFLQTDEKGKELYRHTVGDTTHFNRILSMISTPEDGGYIMCGDLYYNGDFSPYLIKLNANGQKMWDTVYTGFNQDSYFSNILKTPQGEYYVIGGINNFLTGIGSGILLCKINVSNGTIVKKMIYNADTIFGMNYVSDATILRTQDSGFFITSSYSGDSPYGPYQGFMMKLDSLGSFEWISDTLFKDGPMCKAFQTSDGGFVVIGNNDGHIRMVKLSADGQLRWFRRYGSQGTLGRDVISTSDGAYVFVGDTVDGNDSIQKQPLIIRKHNCIGLSTEPQAGFELFLDTLNNSVQCINLSQYVYVDSIDGGHYIWDFGDGVQSYEEHPEHSYTNIGVYTVALRAVICNDTSKFMKQVSVTNCVGSTRLPEASFSLFLDTLSNRVQCTNLSQYVYFNSIGGGHYLWDFGDGEQSYEEHPAHIYTHSGSYTIRLLAVVCNDTSVFNLSVSPILNNSGSLPIGISMVKIYDITGKLMLNTSYYTSARKRLFNLPSGVYVQVLLNKTGKVINTQKVMVVK